MKNHKYSNTRLPRRNSGKRSSIFKNEEQLQEYAHRNISYESGSPPLLPVSRPQSSGNAFSNKSPSQRPPSTSPTNRSPITTSRPNSNQRNSPSSISHGRYISNMTTSSGASPPPIQQEVHEGIDTEEYCQHLASGTSNVLVCVRVRGLLNTEIANGGRDIVRVLDDKVVVLLDNLTPLERQEDFLRANKTREKQFAFDRVFAQSTPTDIVYANTTRFLISGVTSGFNATVFAYGATGAGKTHTMLGSYEKPGIMLQTLTELFSVISSMKNTTSKESKVKCSFIEVYNENIRDLLSPSNDYLELREDPVKGMYVVGISEVTDLVSAEEIMNLLQSGNLNRTTEPTAANATSSRSHAVLTVVVETRDRTSGSSDDLQVGKLSMVDLAGSERASVSHNKGLRLIEGANINRSLLALGNCITALAEKKNGRNIFVPYRDSKLTRFLKDSLGGNCRTVMIANISPCHLNFEDTHNTLKYANRAKNIKTQVSRNVLHVDYHIAKYTQIIAELRDEVSKLRTSLAEKQQQLILHAKQTTSSNQSTLKANDEQTLKECENWQNEFLSIADERTILKKNLIEIVSHLTDLVSEKTMFEQAIEHYDDYSNSPESIAESLIPLNEQTNSICTLPELKAELKRIINGIDRNLEQKEIVEAELKENAAKNYELQEGLPNRIQNSDLRSFLYLIFRTQMLEIENMEINELLRVSNTLNSRHDLEILKLKKSVEYKDALLYAAQNHFGNEAFSVATKGVSVMMKGQPPLPNGNQYLNNSLSYSTLSTTSIPQIINMRNGKLKATRSNSLNEESKGIPIPKAQNIRGISTVTNNSNPPTINLSIQGGAIPVGPKGR